MKSIASADGGTVKGLRVSTFDIRDKGLDLVVKGQRGSPDIRASLEPTGRLQSTALCKNLVLEDKDSKVQLAAYLDDPPPDSSNTHPTTPLPTSQPTP